MTNLQRETREAFDRYLKIHGRRPNWKELAKFVGCSDCAMYFRMKKIGINPHSDGKEPGPPVSAQPNETPRDRVRRGLEEILDTIQEFASQETRDYVEGVKKELQMAVGLAIDEAVSRVGKKICIVCNKRTTDKGKLVCEECLARGEKKKGVTEHGEAAG